MRVAYNLKKIYSFIIFLIFIFSFFIQIYSASEIPNIHNYICDGTDNLAYKSGTNYDSDPDDKTEFSTYEYNIISVNGSSCLDHELMRSRPAHIFNFSITEQVSEISKVELFWKGCGGASATRRDGFNIIIVPYTGCNLRIFNEAIASSTASVPESVSVSITDNFEDIIKNNHLELIASSNFVAGQTIGSSTIDKSYIYSCYVELKIFYNSGGNNPDPESELIINAPDIVLENSDFQVTVLSNSQPINDAEVSFNNSEYYTNEQGKVTLKAPLIDQDSVYIISASKTGFILNSTSIEIQNIEDELPILDIVCDSTVYENNTFEIEVFSQGLAVENALVKFDNEEYLSDQNGKVSLISPLLYVDSSFVISVSKSGYVSSEKAITVKNNEETKYYGKIKGYVTNQSSIEISDVKICVFNKIKLCNYTNTNGEYIFTIPVGEYALDAEKEGYEKKSINFYVEKDTTKWINFSLNETEENNQQTEKTDNQLFFEYVKDDQIKKGLAGAELSNTEDEVLYYSDKIEVEIIQSTQDSFKFSVSADKSTSRKIIFVEMTFDSYSDIKDLEDISIVYDGNKIQRRGIDFLISSKENDTVYSYLESTDDNGKPIFLIAVLIPSFSEHIIEINPILKYYDSFGFIFLYLIICIISSIIFVGSIFLRKRF